MFRLANILLCAFVSGCQSDLDTIDYQIEKIYFRIAIVGEDQKEGTSFPAETDITLALKLINNSGMEFEWKYDYECQIFQTKNFLLVYKWDETDETYMPIGLPYQPPIACLMMNVPSRKVPSGESILIRFPWSTNPANHPLSTSEYYTTSNFTLEINGRSGNWNLRTDFEIK